MTMTNKPQETVQKPRKRRAPQEAIPTWIDILVDRIVAAFGTWQLLVLHIIFFAIWVYFDFNINELTFWVSLEAILLSLIILMSQKRQSENDQIRALADFEVDRYAEKQTRVLIEMVREMGKKIGIDEFAVETKTIELEKDKLK